MARPGALPAGGIRYFRRYLLPQTETEGDFSVGMVRDRTRITVPSGGSYQLTDYFVDKPGLMYKRGGGAYQSGALTGEADIIAIAAPEFKYSPAVLVLTSNGSTTKFWDITTGTPSASTTIGAYNPIENMNALYHDLLPVTCGQVFSNLKKVTNTAGTLAIADWSGGPPQAKYSCVHDGRLILGNLKYAVGGGAAIEYPYQLAISPYDGPEGFWDPSIFYFNTDYPITGLASVNGVLLVFSRGHVQRITGSIPTDAPKSDWVLAPGGNVGCVDARTIQIMDGQCYFANESGVYRTANGSGFDNLTLEPAGTGISALWQATMQGFAPAIGEVVCAGAYLNIYYLLTVLHSGVPTSFLYYAPGSSWVQLSSKVSATMYATSYAPTTELYIGPADSSLWSPPRAQKLSGMWSPSGANKNDVDGTAILPAWETRSFRPGVGLGRWVYGHLFYDMRDAASDNPTMTCQVATGIEADSGYAAMAESPFVETTASLRRRFTPFKDSAAISFRFTQVNPSAKTEIYQLELEEAAYFVADGQ